MDGGRVYECYTTEWYTGPCKPNLLNQEKEALNVDEEQYENSLLTVRTPMHGVMTVKLKCKYLLCYAYFLSFMTYESFIKDAFTFCFVVLLNMAQY